MLRLSLILYLCLIGASPAIASTQGPQDLDVQAVTESTPAQAGYAEQVARLATANYRLKEALIAEIVSAPTHHTRALLEAFLTNRLYVSDTTDAILIKSDDEEDAQLIDAVSGETIGRADGAGISRIRTNNRLRKALKGALAQLNLNDADPALRLAAVNELSRSIDPVTINALRSRLEIESERSVIKAIDTVLAAVDLDSRDPQVRLAAVNRLDGELSPEIFSRLKSMYQPDSNGVILEPDADVRKAARRVAENIGFWRDFYGAIETLFFGLSLGSVLVLAAIGLAITFGVMGVINMAHGELIMLGAYTAYVLQLLLPNHTAWALLLSIPAAFLVAGLVGVAIERGIVRFLYGRPLETLLATFGLSLILQQTVRSIFSPLNRSVSSPDFMSGTLVINDALSLTYNRLYIIVFTLIVFALLMLILKRTSLGLKVRAVSQNRPMARALGVRADWVDAATFGLGAGIAGVAGVALSQLTNVGPNLGQSYIIDSFMVVVFGGVGNLWGTLIGGLSLGVANKLLEPLSGAVLAKILVLVFIILYIQRRPGGMFPQSGRSADNN